MNFGGPHHRTVKMLRAHHAIFGPTGDKEVLPFLRVPLLRLLKEFSNKLVIWFVAVFFFVMFLY